MRPQAQIRLGYYPCPPRVVKMVASHIKLPGVGNKIAIIDPSCGVGDAIIPLAEALGSEQCFVYGVELNEERARYATEEPLFTQVVQADALNGVYWPKYAYHAIWFNPPYEPDKDTKRIEIKFLDRLIGLQYRVMRPGGLFIGVLLRDQMETMATSLLSLLDGMPGEDGKNAALPEVYRHPLMTEEEKRELTYDGHQRYRDFDQVIILGTVRKRKRIINDESPIVKEWAERALNAPFLEAAEHPRWPLPDPFYTGKSKPDEIASRVFDPMVAAHLATQVGWTTRKDLTDDCWGEDIQRVQTLRPLNKAHMAAAMAAGFFNGEMIDGRPEGLRCEMVKGRTLKTTIEIVKNEKQPDGSFKQVDQEQFQSEVFALDEHGQFRIYRMKGTGATNIYQGVEEGDMIKWVEEMQPALVRASARLFPPLVSDEMLATDPLYHIQPLNDRKPEGKQTELIQVVRHQIQHKQPCLVAVEMAGGKSFISLEGIRPFVEAAWAKGERFRTIIITEPHLLTNWKEEAEIAIPGISVSIVEELSDLDPTQPKIKGAKPIKKGRMTDETYARLLRRWSNPHPLDTDIFIMSYTGISLAGNKQIAAVPKPLTAKDHWGELEVVHKENNEIDPRTGRQMPYIVLSCPDCGHILRETDKKNNIVYVTGKSLEARWRRCEAVKTRLVLDEKNGTETRMVQTVDENGQTTWVKRTYRIEVLKNKRGEHIKCNAPLWSHVADPIRGMNKPSLVRESIMTCQQPRHFENQLISVSDIYRAKTGPTDKGGMGSFQSYELQDWSGKTKVKHSGSRKIDFATYLQRHFKLLDGTPIPIDVVIIDEVHKAKAGESARGMAAANIAMCARRSVIGLTGTISGGYSSTMFWLLWRFTPLIRQHFDYSQEDCTRFIHRYGQYQYTRKSSDPDALGDIGRRSRRKSGPPQSKEIPGLSPEAYLLFWKYTIFSELPEIFPNLPAKKDYTKFVELDDEHVTSWYVPRLNPDGTPAIDPVTQGPIFEQRVFTQKTAYAYIQRRLEGEAKQMLARGDRGLLAAMLQTLLRWPNLPTEPIKIMHPRHGTVVVEFPGLRADVLYPKERKLLERIAYDVSEGRPAILYVTHTGVHDVQKRLEWVLSQAETVIGRKLTVASLRSGEVSAVERRDWLLRRCKGEHGEPPCDVLICNPRLVETGLNLIHFADTHWAQIDYSVYVMKQASARTRRPGQKRNVTINYWVYAGTLETGALHLMAQKAKELAKISGSALNDALYQQAGAFNLQELMVQQLTRNLSLSDMTSDEATIQEMLDETAAEEQKQREKILDNAGGITISTGDQSITFNQETLHNLEPNLERLLPTGALDEEEDFASGFEDIFDPEILGAFDDLFDDSLDEPESGTLNRAA